MTERRRKLPATVQFIPAPAQPYLPENQPRSIPPERPRPRRRRVVEPTGIMHYRPTKQRTDGAACGEQNVRFTARIAEVECAQCRRHLPRGRKR